MVDLKLAFQYVTIARAQESFGFMLVQLYCFYDRTTPPSPMLRNF